MKKIKTDLSDLELSVIALGCDCNALRYDRDSLSVLNQAYDLGINFFDTARGYDKSEECIGRWLKSRPEVRDNIFLLTKGCLPFPFSRLNPKCLRKDIEKSLTTLGTHIDMYLLHRDDRRADLKEIFSILNEYHEKGLILNYGVSNWTSERIGKAQQICKENGFAPLKMSSVNYSLTKWKKDPWGGGDGCVSISASRKDLDFYRESKMPVLSFSPLCRGFLSGKVKSDDTSTEKILDHSSKRAYLSDFNREELRKIEEIAAKHNTSVPAVVISYLTHNDIITFLSVGTSKKSSMEKDIAALDLVLSEEEIRYLSLKAE